jgi:transcriptional regulator with XRE-family HTH domain
MTAAEFEQYLLRLNLTGIEAAQLLGVTPRTMQRWLEGVDGDEIPGPAEQALRAWIKLHDLGIPWKPDSRSINVNDEKSIRAHLQHAVEQAALIARVEARGGPRTVWVVDHSRGRAVSGKIEVAFYKLQNRGFSLANYTRRDIAPDLSRDKELIEDAAYYIYLSRRKDPDFGPVTLHWDDISPKNGARPAVGDSRTFQTNEAALKHACKMMGSKGFHEPFITVKGGIDLIFDRADLRQECETRATAPNALEAIATYTRKNKSFFGTRGPTMLTPIERANHEKHIESLADKLDALADKAREGRTDYQQFDAVLGELHAANFFPDRDLVSAAARALVQAKGA